VVLGCFLAPRSSSLSFNQNFDRCLRKYKINNPKFAEILNGSQRALKS
jgi:hypothetical protein